MTKRSCSGTRRLALPRVVISFVTALAAMLAHSEEPTTKPTVRPMLATLKEQAFEKSGIWYRPQPVRFAILVGCGGGSGGSSSSAPNRWVPGVPGRAAPILTIVVGPLDQATYDVTIGNGGAGAQSSRKNPEMKSGGAGAETVFSWGGAQPGEVHFPAASPASTDIDPYLTGMKGRDGPQSGPATVVPKTDEVVTGSLGGQGAIGRGGDGSPFNVSGATGGFCAGGGGSGSITIHDQYIRVEPKGGDGGPGHLMIIPLVDASVVEERLTEALKGLQNMQPPKSEPAAPAQTSEVAKP
jgi:hypothetical protein